MNRRDFLKVTAAGLVYATVMTNDLLVRSFGNLEKSPEQRA